MADCYRLRGLIGCTGLPAVSGILRTQARRRGSRHPGHCRRETNLPLRLRRRPSTSPPSSCLAGRSRARCHTGRVTGPGPGSGHLSPPPLLAAHAAGTGAARAGPRRLGAGPDVLTICCLRRGLAGPAPSGVQPRQHAGVQDRHRTAPLGPGASRRASRGGALLGPTLPDAERRLRSPRASCRESRVSTGPRAGAPERHGAAQLGDRRRAPRAPQECARGPGRHPRIACGSESQPERHCTASPGTGEVAAGPA